MPTINQLVRRPECDIISSVVSLTVPVWLIENKAEVNMVQKRQNS